MKALYGRKILFPLEPRKVEPIFSPNDSINIPAFLAAVKEVLKSLPKKEFLPKAVVTKVMSLEDMITRLTKRVTDNLRMSFREFSKDDRENKVHVIVSFLAMLELVKQAIISVAQEKHFEDIIMETEALETNLLFTSLIQIVCANELPVTVASRKNIFANFICV